MAAIVLDPESSSLGYCSGGSGYMPSEGDRQCAHHRPCVVAQGCGPCHGRPAWVAQGCGPRQGRPAVQGCHGDDSSFRGWGLGARAFGILYPDQGAGARTPVCVMSGKLALCACPPVVTECANARGLIAS
eukprot:scaffold14396_cov17-Tisochrysis_lutea.AAC.1